ncbi:MAG: haloacid dehalogenase-like hydrolase [Verrucomicrobia bacterium]|nr:haloacid dehalogenase-like hydrolase [Verrucomicrobiota bacterium]
MPIRIAWFDIDGTLLRTGGAGSAAFEDAAREVFKIPEGMKGICFAGRTDRSLVLEFFRRHGIPEREENIARFYRVYLRRLAERLPRHRGGLCPGVKPFLDALREQRPDLALGLLTGNLREGARLKLTHYGLWDRFSIGVFGDDHADRNELGRQALEIARRALGPDLAPPEMVVVGDTPADVACGRSAGAKTLAVATGGASLETLERARPDWSVEALTRAALKWFA